MKLLYKACWLIIRVYLRLFCKLQIEGVDNVPLKGAVIIAANHIAAGDPPFIGACVKRECYFLAKRELFQNYFLGKLLSKINSIPVKRGVLDRTALNTAEEALRNGKGLILFPEGTRSRSGVIGKGKPGVGLLARQILVPIVPAYIENSRGFLTLVFKLKRLKVRFGEPLTTDWVASFPDDKEGYRAIARELMDRIRRLGQREPAELYRL